MKEKNTKLPGDWASPLFMCGVNCMLERRPSICDRVDGIHEWKIGRKVWGKYFAGDYILSLCRLYESRVYIRITYWFPIIAGTVHWRLLWNSWIAAYKNYIYLLEDVSPFVIRRLNKCASYFSSYRLSIIVRLAVTTIHPSLGNCWTRIDTCWKKMSHWSFSTTHSLSQAPPY